MDRHMFSIVPARVAFFCIKILLDFISGGLFKKLIQARIEVQCCISFCVIEMLLFPAE
jgi:hypothetical protein